jgi:uracil phosphoribosyltransferase
MGKIPARRAVATEHVASPPMASSASRDFPNLTVLSHPLIQHKLTILRDKRTSTRDFKQLVNEIAMLMAYEVTKDLPLEPVEIETPLEKMRGSQVAGKKLTLVPILRAGLGMVEGISQLIPSARVGHIGLYRNHDTLQPVDYYFKIPSGEADRAFFLLDPMLATGGSAVAAVTALVRAGAPVQRIRFMCLVCAPEGVRAMLDAHPKVPVYAASLDRELNSKGYILPGLGDAGDRLFGTR